MEGNIRPGNSVLLERKFVGSDATDAWVKEKLFISSWHFGCFLPPQKYLAQISRPNWNKIIIPQVALVIFFWLKGHSSSDLFFNVPQREWFFPHLFLDGLDWNNVRKRRSRLFAKLFAAWEKFTHFGNWESRFKTGFTCDYPIPIVILQKKKILGITPAQLFSKTCFKVQKWFYKPMLSVNSGFCKLQLAFQDVF